MVNDGRESESERGERKERVTGAGCVARARDAAGALGREGVEQARAFVFVGGAGLRL